MMLTNLRGEMTVDKEQQFRLKEGKFVRTVATALKVGSEKVNGRPLFLFISFYFSLAASLFLCNSLFMLD